LSFDLNVYGTSLGNFSTRAFGGLYNVFFYVLQFILKCQRV